MFRILVLALAVLTAFVPFVPAIVFATVAVAFAIDVLAQPIRYATQRLDVRDVALLALVPFRAPPAFV